MRRSEWSSGFRGAAQQISEDMVAFDRHAAFDVAQHRGLQRRTCGGQRRPRLLQGRAGAAENPQQTAMAAHSFRSFGARSEAPAATYSPIAARIRQVIPAAAAMNTHFSHISCRISSLSRASKPAPSSADATVSIRCEREPSKFAERKRVQFVEVDDAAIGVDRRRDHGLPAEHALSAEAIGENIEMSHAVQQTAESPSLADGLCE